MSDYAEKLKDPRWQRKRLEVLQRDGFKCTSCKDETRTLHVHHDVYHGNPWECPMKDLVTLCERCHDRQHRFKSAFFAMIHDYVDELSEEDRNFQMVFIGRFLNKIGGFWAESYSRKNDALNAVRLPPDSSGDHRPTNNTATSHQGLQHHGQLISSPNARVCHSDDCQSASQLTPVT